MNGSAFIAFKVLHIDRLKLLDEDRTGLSMREERGKKESQLEAKKSPDDLLNICFEEEKDTIQKQLTIQGFVEKECLPQLWNSFQNGIPGVEGYQSSMKLYVVILVGGRKLLVADIDKRTQEITYTVF